MNRCKETYDRYMVGERIQRRRQSLGMSQEVLAERIDRATKYCSDIERGICGMSIETMLAFAEHLDLSLDYMMYGIEPKNEDENKTTSDAVLSEPLTVERIEMDRLLDSCSERQFTYALRMMEVFMEATTPEEEKE